MRARNLSIHISYSDAFELVREVDEVLKNHIDVLTYEEQEKIAKVFEEFKKKIKYE